MALRIALLLVVGLLLGTPSGRARPPEVGGALQAWRRAVWESDTNPFPAAAPALRRLSEDPRFADDREILFALAWATRFEDEAAATEVVARLRDAHPSAPELGLFDSFEHHDAGRAAEARASLERLVGHVRSGDGRVPNAEEIDLIVTLVWGSRSLGAEEWDDTIAAFEEARRLVRARGSRLPRWAIVSLAEVHRQQLQLGRAAEVLAEAARDDPEFPGHPYELARVYAMQARDDEAVVWYRRAQDLDPNFAPPYLKLAVIASRFDDLDEMRRQLEGVHDLTRRQWAADPGRREWTMAAEIQAGFGQYFQSVARREAAAGNAGAARTAYEAAMRHLEASLLDNPLCRRALIRLVEVGALLGTAQDKIDAWKRTLDEIGIEVDGTMHKGAGSARGRSFC